MFVLVRFYYSLFWSFDTVCCDVPLNVMYIVNAERASIVHVTIKFCV